METVCLENATAFGVSPGASREIHIVASNPADVYRKIAVALNGKGVVPLLLPYCAKLPACPYRYTEGCGKCGGCDIGDAYQLAEQFRLTPFTIQNYEMLEARLSDIRLDGTGVFIGLCCTAFFFKHRQDFERIGLPGLLIDVDSSTCYDLGKEHKAQHGLFEHQTRLKLEVLKQVLDALCMQT